MSDILLCSRSGRSHAILGDLGTGGVKLLEHVGGGLLEAFDTGGAVVRGGFGLVDLASVSKLRSHGIRT